MTCLEVLHNINQDCEVELYQNGFLVTKNKVKEILMNMNINVGYEVNGIFPVNEECIGISTINE